MNTTSITSPFKSFDPKLVIAVLFIIIIWGANWLLVDMFFQKIEHGGQFGDRFGAATSLFGGITIVFLLYTIYDQRKANQDSKISFGKEMEQLKKQVRIQSYQRFENTFFHHIKLHQTIAENIESSDIALLTLRGYVYNIVRGIVPTEDYDKITNEFRSKHEGYIKATFGQYILNYQNTIDFIYLHKKNKQTQEKYIKTYLLQLHNYELLFIFLFYTLKNNEPPKNFKLYINIIYTLISYNPKNDKNIGLATIASKWNARIQFNEFV